MPRHEGQATDGVADSSSWSRAYRCSTYIASSTTPIATPAARRPGAGMSALRRGHPVRVALRFALNPSTPTRASNPTHQIVVRLIHRSVRPVTTRTPRPAQISPPRAVRQQPRELAGKVTEVAEVGSVDDQHRKVVSRAGHDSVWAPFRSSASAAGLSEGSMHRASRLQLASMPDLAP